MLMVFILYAMLIFGALAAILYIGSVWFQGTIYSEPAAGLIWRAPLAAAVLTAYFILFHIIAQGPDSFNTLFSFSARQSKQFPEFRCELTNHESQLFRYDPRDKTYKDPSGKPWKRATPDAIVEKIIAVEKDDQGNDREATFTVDLTSDKKFKKNPETGLQEARYLEEGGSREMVERDIGYVTTFRFWFFLGNFLLNLAHVFFWFAALWLILRYQWTHALLLAAVIWLPVTLLLLPWLRGLP
jgi:hypothetical protein